MLRLRRTLVHSFAATLSERRLFLILALFTARIWLVALSILLRWYPQFKEAVVPFGHAGFSHRVSQFPFHVNSAAENVAMSHGFSSRQVAKIAVDGWIDSPGHRRNLLR